MTFALTMHIAVWVLIAMAGSAVIALALLPLARRIGWMDHPDTRKVHREATPLVGGVAIFLAFFGMCYWIQAPEVYPQVVPLFVASLIMLFTGLVDDRYPLSATIRFAAQGVACLVMIYWGGIRLDDFGSLFWPSVLELGPLAVPITIFAALGVINAFNMIDGLDGLSGSLFLVALAGIALASIGAMRRDELTLLLLMGGCVAGFLLLNARLPWNPRARTFLGDSGSVLLGFWLGWMFIDLGNDQGAATRAFAPMTAVWIFGLPLLDTTRLMRNRWKAGKSAFEADRTHLHHAFLVSGCTVGQAWWRMVGLSAAFAAVGVVFQWLGVPEYVSFYAFVVTGLVYLSVMKRAWAKLASARTAPVLSS